MTEPPLRRELILLTRNTGAALAAAWLAVVALGPDLPAAADGPAYTAAEVGSRYATADAEPDTPGGRQALEAAAGWPRDGPPGRPATSLVAQRPGGWFERDQGPSLSRLPPTTVFRAQFQGLKDPALSSAGCLAGRDFLTSPTR